MFYYIEGTVAHLEQNLAVIDAAGIGYACRTSQNTLGNLKEGGRARLFTHLYVREDILELYGFLDLEELNCFKLLIAISGVGPKAALSILSAAPPQQVALSIMTGDDKLLTRAPGIGKKIAQRIVLELRDKMAKQQIPTGGKSVAPIQTGGDAGNQTQEAVSALMVLGYSQAEALVAMDGLDLNGMRAEEIIRQCLKRLAKAN